ncbi:MAG: hypothetical protein U5P10_08465 [Spirochaetia bacterium]|nr:hypothetical protein [Spirochaetia bacterium]
MEKLFPVWLKDNETGFTIEHFEVPESFYLKRPQHPATNADTNSDIKKMEEVCKDF